MNDPHPQTLELEIDREGLRRYLRLLSCIRWLFSFGFTGGFIGLSRGFDFIQGLKVKVGPKPFVSLVEPLLLLAKYATCGVAIGLAVGLLFYLLWGRRSVERQVSSLRVTVEGAFLRIRQHVFLQSDRKLHFRALVDYDVVQDGLMRRCGVHTLRITTTSGGPASIVAITGLKDCLKARDLLSEVDRLRE